MEKQASQKPKRQGHRPHRRVTAARLTAQTDELLREAELTLDQQHQLLTVKRLLMLEPNEATPEGQAALACAELVVDAVRLSLFQRRYGLGA